MQLWFPDARNTSRREESTAGRGSGLRRQGGEKVIMVASENCKQVTDSELRACGGGGRKGVGARTGMINKSPLWKALLSK